jgi:prepilin-type N-terminal cleavage/methylation domain-containing protein
MVAHHTLTSRTWTARARQSTATRPARRAFTLVELLVVITIIAILIGLLIVTLGPIIVRSSDFRLQSEIEQLAAACEKFKEEFGFYPPDFHHTAFVVDPTVSPLVPLPYATVRPALLQIVNTGWPNHQETTPDPTDNSKERLEVWWEQVGSALAVSGHETALWYWLSQTFNDAQFPLSGRRDTTTPAPSVLNAGVVRKSFFDFDNERLHALVEVVYLDPDPTTPAVESTFLYHFEQDGYGETPYIYFHNLSYGLVWTPSETEDTEFDGDVVGIYIDPTTNLPYDPTSFQIIAAGSDSDYGDTNTGDNPNSPTPPDIIEAPPYDLLKDPRLDYDADNITNFSEGRIETMKVAQ